MRGRRPGREHERTIEIPIESDEAGETIMPKKPGGEPAPAPLSQSKQSNEEPERKQSPEDGRLSGAEPTPREDAESGVEMELETTLDHLKRLQAEFDNYRRRSDRERLEIGDRAQGVLIARLLPVLDDLDRAAGMVEDKEGPLAKGFLLVRDKLFHVLEEAGMERIPAVGETFDPHRHEALLTEPVEPERAEQVLEELVVGYTFKGRVIRPTRVKVGVAADAE